MEYEFQILTDSVSDLPRSWLNDHPQVRIIDTPINISGGHQNETYYHQTADDFMAIDARVKNGGIRAMTSQPQIFDPNSDSLTSVETITRRLLENGKDVLYVVMNGSLSGTCGMVSMLYRDINEEYQGSGHRAIYVDSHCMGTGLALLIMELWAAYERGEVLNVGEMADFVMKNRGYVGHFFTWGELSYIRKSGRVDAVRAMAANLLGIRLIGAAEYIDDETRKLEHVNPHTFVRGISRWADIIGIYAQRHIADPHGTIIVAHGNVPRDADIVTCKLMDYLPQANYLTGPDWRCGAGIQCHGGPTSLHVNFMTDRIGYKESATREFVDIIRNYRK